MSEMTLDELIQKKVEMNTQIDMMKSNLREVVRDLNRKLASAKIDAMAPEEREALRLALGMKGPAA